MKKFSNLDATQRKDRIVSAVTFVLVAFIAVLFAFPLYWILTGAFKSGADINSTKEILWWPTAFVGENFDKLMNKRSAPLFEIAFKLYRYGYGSAMGVILAIIIAILSAIQFWAGKEK